MRFFRTSCSFFTIILFVFSTSAFAKEQSFQGFISAVKKQAIAQGISRKTVDTAFKNVKHLKRVIHHDRHQAQSVVGFEIYLTSIVTKERIQDGYKNLMKYNKVLTNISHQYDVPPQYILALWGLETNYGEFVGNYPEFSSLATLAYDKRRSDYFKKELFAALKIVDKGLAPMKDMHGSWAGALGQCQFMPSDFIAFGVDYDKSGRADIWHSVPDVLASTANYLHSFGWNKHHRMLFKVRVKHAIEKKKIGLKFKQSIKKWEKLGVEIINPVNMKEQTGNYSLLFPAGKKGPAYLVNHHNFDIILSWNDSKYYALSVGTLANAIVSHHVKKAKNN